MFSNIPQRLQNVPPKYNGFVTVIIDASRFRSKQTLIGNLFWTSWCQSIFLLLFVTKTTPFMCISTHAGLISKHNFLPDQSYGYKSFNVDYETIKDNPWLSSTGRQPKVVQKLKFYFVMFDIYYGASIVTKDRPLYLYNLSFSYETHTLIVLSGINVF